MAILYLPPEIWREILLRLPITTLTTTARFVNKGWFGIICSSEFVKARLKNSTLSDHRVVYNFSNSGLLLEQFSVEPLLCDSSSIDLVNFGYPKAKNSAHTVWLAGSCNGLICLVSTEKWITLLNPCTGSYNELPCSLDDLERTQRTGMCFGFGYDESNDDYKLVGPWNCRNWGVGRGGEKRYWFIVKVYSLKSNSWKSIEDFEGGGIIASCLGSFASGKFHWFREDLARVTTILSFDMGSEVFGMIELPIDDYNNRRTLDVLGGCTCLLVEYFQSRVDLWVMKEYGVKESWTKIVTVSYTNFPEKLSLRSLLPNGEIYFSATQSFVVYNPNDGSFKFLDTASVHSPYLNPLIYVQSLVSPICTQVRGRKKAKLV